MDDAVTRRAFVIHMGTAAALLGGAVPAPAQTAPAPVPGKEKLIVRSPRPINLETPFGQLGADITPSTPERFGTVMKADAAKWGKVVKAANIKAD